MQNFEDKVKFIATPDEYRQAFPETAGDSCDAIPSPTGNEEEFIPFPSIVLVGADNGKNLCINALELMKVFVSRSYEYLTTPKEFKIHTQKQHREFLVLVANMRTLIGQQVTSADMQIYHPYVYPMVAVFAENEDGESVSLTVKSVHTDEELRVLEEEYKKDHPEEFQEVDDREESKTTPGDTVTKDLPSVDQTTKTSTDSDTYDSGGDTNSSSSSND